MNCLEVSNKTDPDLIFEIYRDINSGAANHSDQQIRKWVPAAAVHRLGDTQPAPTACWAADGGCHAVPTAAWPGLPLAAHCCWLMAAHCSLAWAATCCPLLLADGSHTADRSPCRAVYHGSYTNLLDELVQSDEFLTFWGDKGKDSQVNHLHAAQRLQMRPEAAAG